MGNLYQGNSGKTYSISENKIAGGGEGGIYLIENSENQVAKIFKPEKRTSQREEKLRLMVKEHLSNEELKQVTWPQDVIYNQTGFVGYIMPKLMYSSSLTEIYSTDKYDLRYRLMVAINLCAAVDTIHEMGQVCGDLNPQNICVNLNENDKENAFHVTLVDTDSYHFTANDTTYRCEVGLGDYIAPELQKKMSKGMDLKSVSLPSYTKETDLFALAVHIFYLLMNGCHPFACAKTGTPQESNIEQMKSGMREESVVAPQPIENIVNGFFPFVDQKEGITIPIYAPGFEALPPNVRNLFIRTFKNGYENPAERVSALEWQKVLTSLLPTITQCSSKEKHYYFQHNDSCPLCEIEGRINAMLGIVEPQVNVHTDSVEQNIVISKKTGITASRILKIICLGICLLLVIFSIRNCSERNLSVSNKTSSERKVSIETTISIEEQYSNWLDAAQIYYDSGDFDTTILCCDTAISIIQDYSDAYYYKARALYGKNELDQANAQFEYIKDKYEYRVSYSDISELETQINDSIEARAEQERIAKENQKKLKKMNKILAKIKEKKYKKAGELIDTYCADNYFGKIYVQNGQIVDTITSGKGFMISEKGWYAYYGSFKNGKMNGKGIQVGYNYQIEGTFKKNKLNGPARVYCWNEYFGGKKCEYVLTGNYKNNKENGRMKIAYSGGETNTYYYNANNGVVNYYDYSDGLYIYGETSDGEWRIGTENKSSLDNFVSPAIQ